MKKILSLLLSVLMLLSVNAVLPVYAADDNSFTYSLLDDGTYEISGYSGSQNTVKIPYSYNLKSVTSIGIAAFYQNSYSFTTVDFPSSIKTINIAAFANNDNLRWINLNEGLERIEDSAFETCVMLSAVHFPSTLQYLGSGVFAYDESITRFTVAEGNEYFSSDGTVLYNADKSKLILYPAAASGDSFTVPFSVKEIGEGAFTEAVTTKSVTIPLTLEKIESGAFDSAASIKDIYFLGSESEWKSINGYKNVSGINVHYSPCAAHSFQDVEIIREATCTEAGEKTVRCSVCGKTESETIDALEHNYQSVITPPTCTEKGYTTNTCSRCKDSYISDEKNALGHDWSTAEFLWTGYENATASRTCKRDSAHTETVECVITSKVITEAKPTVSGEREYTATASFDDETTVTDKKTEPIPATGYTYRFDRFDWSENCKTAKAVYVANEDENESIEYDAVITSDVKKEASCTENGITKYTATHGENEETKEIDDIVSLGHNYLAEVTQPSCEKAGYTTYTCSRCDDSYIGDEVEALGHDFGEWYEAVAPDCVNFGTEERDCARCGEAEKQPIEPLGHSFSEDKEYCLNGCGEKNPDYKPSTEPSTEPSSKATTRANDSSAKTTEKASSSNSNAQGSVTVKTPKLRKLKKGKRRIKAFWKKVKGVSGYQLQVSASKKFKKKKTKNIIIKRASKTKRIVKKLKSNKKYFVRIRAYKVVNGKKYYSKWSKVKKVKTK